MTFENDNKQQPQQALSNENVFKLLEEANTQYEKYIELRTTSLEGKPQSHYSNIKRDINYPLTFVIR